MLTNRSSGLEERRGEAPIGLAHIDSDLCWCEPIVETDEDGREVVVHREITWN